jgi:hypothetical protein
MNSKARHLSQAISRLVIALACFILSLRGAAVVVFTNDAIINSFVTNYEGNDIIVSNCTLTVDGPHAFLSLLVAPGATVTHSYSSNGIVASQHFITNEPHVLLGTNAATLDYPGIVVAQTVTDSSGSITYTQGVDYALLFAGTNEFQIARTPGSTIPDGATVLVSYTVQALIAAGLTLNIAGDVEVSAGGAINVNGRGYGGGYGPGVGHGSLGNPADGSGGGYGGMGGTSSSNAVGGVSYGYFDAPADLGSGGGSPGVIYVPGSPGGGLIKLVVGGAIHIDGAISANGLDATNTRTGGGSGGSVWLTGASIGGSGTITVNGGAGEPVRGGGGGGGRICLQADAIAFSGSAGAYGGHGWQAGGAGTLFTKLTGQTGLLLVDNGGRTGTNTTLTVANGADVTVRRGAGVMAPASWTVRNLAVESNSVLLTLPLATLSISAVNVTVDPGGGLVADNMGYGPGNGPGAGNYSGLSSYYPCGGGGHGGCGGSSSISTAPGGTAYDSQTSPSVAGSGGGRNFYPPVSVSGSGGGVIQLSVLGALVNNGRISANGGAGSGAGGGGGAGGSLNVTVFGTLSGTGLFSADGGNGAGAIGGGGGGGRIVVNPGTDTFAGIISAWGGGGGTCGGAGTVFIYGSMNQLILDNGGRAGTNTPIQTASNADLVVRNGAVGTQTNASLTFLNLFVGSNSWLKANTPGAEYPGQVNLIVTADATIQNGGGIITDAVGSGPGEGTGRGRTFYDGFAYYLGGGGHGGFGGGSTLSQSLGGNVYDATTQPRQTGSGGGQSPLPNYLSGRGGGTVRLNVTGALQMDGWISVNGGNASGLGGGGGSGGSVWLTLGGFAGTGAIMANGGNGAYDSSTSGGGGGGRIAIWFNTNTFTGSLSAYGGGFTNYGGAGTVYLRNSLLNSASLLVDNGGNTGTNTPIGTDISSPFVDLTLGGGAVAYSSYGSWGIQSLLVRSNSTLVPGWLRVSGDATIDPGGALSADGTGNGPGLGAGAGLTHDGISGGGGHGGCGGGNFHGGGGAYGRIITPNAAGSGGASGGISSYPPFGGSGGGMGTIDVDGTLTVNGRLSANGTDGESNSGGGSGGGLFIIIGTLAGSGVISANGGAGTGNAGGGGGGRIAISWTSNRFTGPITATGGNGYFPGGAGTIYLKSSLAPVGQLFVDNGGLAGTNTPLSFSYYMPNLPFNLVISGGASALAAGSWPVLSNLTVRAGSQLTVDPFGSLTLGVLSNIDIAANASISVTGSGNRFGQGPGAGATLNSKGGGAGYGGEGGASASGAGGGITYGSVIQPADRGSGGGAGGNPTIIGSEGGGILRLSVGGALNIEGTISADGNIGLQEDSGGGSGGSIWLSANHISGSGGITAKGGNGDLYGGGGGGGGRIAVYSPANTFTGLVTIAGGAGANFGQDGTLYLSNSFFPFNVLSSSPSRVVSNLVSYVDLTFSEVVNTYTVSALGFTLNTPLGPLPQASLSASALAPSIVRVRFPPQSTPGDYTFQLSSGITSLFGQPLAQLYKGAFGIMVPTISGTVTDTNGPGVAGVRLQPSGTYYGDGTYPGVYTDPHGNYLLGVPPGWHGTVTPSLGTSMFIPSFLSFTNVSVSLTGQNFLMVPTISPLLSSSVSDGNFSLTWRGFAGVSYQPYWSTNLVNWQALGAPLPGTNGLMQFVTPLDGHPLQFFRVRASD